MRRIAPIPTSLSSRRFAGFPVLERFAAIALAALGASFILLGLVGLPLGYFMAESDNTGLLVGATAVFLVVGLLLLLIVRQLFRSNVEHLGSSGPSDPRR